MDFNINKDLRVKLELDFIDASLVVEAINTQLDILLKNPSLETIVKYACLAQVGKNICDQVIPVDQQEGLMQKYKQDQFIIQSLKKEKGE